MDTILDHLKHNFDMDFIDNWELGRKHFLLKAKKQVKDLQIYDKEKENTVLKDYKKYIIKVFNEQFWVAENYKKYGMLK